MPLRNPYWLSLLIFLPFAAYGFFRHRAYPAVRFPSLRHLTRRQRSLRIMLLPVLPFLRICGLALLIFALARPQKGTAVAQDFSRGVAIMMALDISGSMRAEDFVLNGRPVTRLDAVKYVFRRFVLGGEGLPGRPYDEIGIVAFGGFAISRAPLTLDHTALIDLLKDIKIPEIDPNDPRAREELLTALGDGLALSVERLRRSPAKSKVVILLSDGKSNAGEVEPIPAAKIAKEFGIKVYTIGVGHTGYAPVKVYDQFGRPFRQRIFSELDEETLKEIARITGGKYFHAENLEGLRQIYREIDQLEKAELKTKVFFRFQELFGPYLLLGMGLLLLEVFLSHTYLRRIP